MISHLKFLLFLTILSSLISCDNKPKKVTNNKLPNDSSQNINKNALTVDNISVKPDIINPTQIDKPPKKLSFAKKLSMAALERTTHDITYDGSYIKIAYPMGDVPDSIGVCTDVVIRAYRELGIDLQQRLHEDIKKNFKRYPSQKLWGLSRPDTNIDHRRVPNLRVFFNRHGQSLPITDNPKDYFPGDIVTWNLSDNIAHIGIVSGEASFNNPERYMIIHNIGSGTELGDILFNYDITGHYRYGL